jgi:TonB family protein
LKGEVEVDFVIDAKGGVVSPKVLNASAPEFAKRAMIAMQRWKFTPGKKDGQPVSTHVHTRFGFGEKEWDAGEVNVNFPDQRPPEVDY